LGPSTFTPRSISIFSFANVLILTILEFSNIFLMYGLRLILNSLNLLTKNLWMMTLVTQYQLQSRYTYTKPIMFTCNYNSWTAYLHLSRYHRTTYW
jgi:hypothetical protein